MKKTRHEKNIQNRDESFLLSKFNPSDFFPRLSDTITVNKQTALSIPAFSSAVKIISQIVATLPVHIYKKNGDNRDKDIHHFLYRLIHAKPNNYMTSFDFWEYLVRDLILEGNSYCLIERGVSGKIIALHPLTAAMVVKRWDDLVKNYLYYYSTGSKTVIYPTIEIWHLMNSGDGITGQSIIEQHKDTIKQALTIEAFTSLYFEQGVSSNLILETPEGVEAPKETAILAMKKFWKKINRQKDKHIPNIIPGGMTVKELKHMNLSESQLIELKTYVVQQIARIFLLPPHILSDLSKSSFNNIQEQNRNILTFAINPYLHRIEKSMNAFLLNPSEQLSTYCEFTRDALIEANPVEKSEQVKNLTTSGVYTINQAKAMYNLPSVEGGDETFILNQMTTLNNLKKELKNEEK